MRDDAATSGPDRVIDVDLDVGAETMAFGRDRPPARRWPRVVAGLLAVLAVVTVLADRAAREREVEALLTDVESVSAAVALADYRITSMQLYLRPVSASGPSSRQLAVDLDALVAEAAARGEQEVRGRLADVESEAVLPWHGDLRSGRDRLAAYVTAEADRLGTAGERSRRPADDAALVELLAVLRAAVGPSERLDTALARLPGAGRLP